MKTNLFKILIAGAALAVLVGVFVAGRWSRGGSVSPSPAQGLAATGAGPQATAMHSCPMHPQIRQPQPGRCPICGMELTPLAASSAEEDAEAPILRVSRRAAALMEIQTAPAERRHVEAERRFLGKFVYDETRLTDIALRTEGQIQRLFVNYTGVPVRQGEHIAEIYSPEFLSASEELLLTSRVASESSLLESAKSKLRLLDVTQEQIEDILRQGAAKKTFTLYSPVNGVLTELGGRQGGWLMKGERVAQIADLS